MLGWIESEKRETKIRFELRRLKNRAKARPLLLCFCSLASALLLISYKLSKKENYKASVVIRVTEGSIYRENSPLAGQRMDEYLRSVTLTNTQMLDIVKEFSLYPIKRAKGDQYAIDEIRSASKIKIVNNYFAAGHYLASSARTAQITVEFSHKESKTAYDVVKRLSNAMISNERKRREKVGQDLLTIAAKTKKVASDHVAVVQDNIASTQLLWLTAQEAKDAKKSGQLKVALKGLEKRYRRLQTTLMKLDKNTQDAAMMLKADEANLGLQFKVVDERAPLPQKRPSVVFVLSALLGLTLLLLPFFSILIGAFDFRILDKNDLERLGFSTLGSYHPQSHQGNA